MIDIKIHIKNNDEFVAAMVKALSFQTAPNFVARSASVKGASMNRNGDFILHMADEDHRFNFSEAISTYLHGLTEIVSN
jgi:hypothetical protein